MHYATFELEQTWANYGPRAKSGPPVILFWPTVTNTNLNSHRELSGRPFFSLNGSDFQQNKPQRCKIGIKNEVKTFHFGDHIRTWTVISKKKSSPCFPISVRPAASTVFPNLALRVKSLPTPELEPFLCFSKKYKMSLTPFVT